MITETRTLHGWSCVIPAPPPPKGIGWQRIIPGPPSPPKTVKLVGPGFSTLSKEALEKIATITWCGKD